MRTKQGYLLTDYQKYASQVVEWNLIANGGALDQGKEAISVQNNLIKEELEELIKSFRLQLRKEFAKELCDLFVVTSFMVALAYEDRYAHYIGQEILHIDIQKSLQDLQYLFQKSCYKEMVTIICDLLSSLNFDGAYCLAQVCNNNFTKFSLYDGKDERYDEEAKQIEQQSKGRYTNVVWLLNSGFVIYKDSKGKILKPLNYKPLDLILVG